MNSQARIFPAADVLLGIAAVLALVFAAFAVVTIDREFSVQAAPLHAVRSHAVQTPHHAMLLAPAPAPGVGEPAIRVEDLPQWY